MRTDTPGNGAPNTRNLLSVRQFRERLRRERGRADRSGRCFSLAVFPLRGKDAETIQTVLDAAVRRLRATDAAGYYDDQSLGVILVDTHGRGAEIYAGEIVRCCGLNGDSPAFWTRSYPRLASLHGREADAETCGYNYADILVASKLAVAPPRWKRVLDICGATAGILLFSPLFLFMPLYVRLVSPGPVFYRQKRVGYRGELFTFLKFRTMHVDNDQSAHAAHLKSLIAGDESMIKLDSGGDPRVIPGGAILRALSLDEVPQFINVLRGDMSLVGPRPCIPYEAEEFLRWHTHRFDSLPGISGLWQVSGKNRLSFKEMIRLDIRYAKRMSPLLDIRILLATFPSMLIELVLKLRERFKKSTQGGTDE